MPLFYPSSFTNLFYSYMYFHRYLNICYYIGYKFPQNSSTEPYNFGLQLPCHATRQPGGATVYDNTSILMPGYKNGFSRHHAHEYAHEYVHDI